MNVKISCGAKEDGIVIGNTYDKYGSQNLVVKWMMKKFDLTLSDFVNQVSPRTIHEIGCGEGYWVLRWHEKGFQTKGSDFSKKIIEIARGNASSRGVPTSLFEAKSIYNLSAEQDSADLIVCCEVLEHLEDPENGLKALQKVVNGYLVASVPREPIWRALNLARAKYVRSFGNTPGHIQHWSKHGFIQLISKYFEIIETKSPVPWTMVLCRPKR